MRYKKLLQDLIVPVMTENGYKSEIENTSGFFEKENTISGQKQRIYLDIFSDSVVFHMELTPTTKYQFIKTSEVFANDEGLCRLGDFAWNYENDMELRKILEYVAVSMENYGFQYLEMAAKDPDDIYATPEEHMDLYLHHEEYAGEFFQKHHLTNWDVMTTVSIIEEELKRLPQVPSQIDRTQMIRLAASYGHIYATKGGKWKLKNGYVRIELAKMGSKWEQDVEGPLNWIYSCVSCNQRDKVGNSVLKNLKNFGYL